MAGFFNYTYESEQPDRSVQYGLMGINLAAAAVGVYRIFQEPENIAWYGLDICTHMLTFYFAQNRIPSAVQSFASNVNLLQAGAILGTLSTVNSSASFALTVVDSCLHLANARLIMNEDAAHAIYP